jgi:ABC-type Fe3+ transport system substrate-binding protein
LSIIAHEISCSDAQSNRQRHSACCPRQHRSCARTERVSERRALEFYGEQKGAELVRSIAASLRPVITDGHLAMARAVGVGEYWVALNNYVNLSMNVKLAGNPIDVWPLDPVTLIFGQVSVNVKAPHPNAARLAANFMLSQECQEFLAGFGRLPTRKDVAANPPGIIDRLTQKKVITVLMGPDEERQWQRRFDQLLKGR